MRKWKWRGRRKRKIQKVAPLLMRPGLNFGPEQILRNIENISRGVLLRTGDRIQILRTNKIKNIWCLEIFRDKGKISFNDTNRSKDITVIGTEIEEIVRRIALTTSCEAKKIEKISREGLIFFKITSLVIEKEGEKAVA